LLLTFNAGRIASGATRSVIVMGRSEVNLTVSLRMGFRGAASGR
jgi:hypothetical protein